MRLIQPTLLLLLVAIHCESSCPVLHDDKPEREKQLKKCIEEKCQNELDYCFGEVAPRKCLGEITCMSDRCITGKADTCYEKAKKECIKEKGISCPGKGAKGREVLVKRRKLAKEFGKNVWKAVATEDRFQDGFLNDPCSKLNVSVKCDKNGQEWVYLELSSCPGNSQTGECWTAGFENYYGIGMQKGDSGIFELILTNEDFVVPTNPDRTNRLTLYVHQIQKGAFAVVSLCGITYTKRLLLSGRMIFSPEDSYASLRRNIDNATLTKLDQAVSKFGGPVYGMKNGGHCTN